MRRTPEEWWREEKAALARGFRVIGGVDEAGRGPLAGPVVAACVVLPFGCGLPGVRDSKTLSPDQRQRAYDRILERAQAIGVGMAHAEAIDRMNVLRAGHEAMRQAVASCAILPDVALLDGLPVHPFPVPQIALVKGDSRSISVAAASIVAKVVRDRYMVEQHALWPQYGFDSHKGYSTPEHLARLREHGPCPLHRRSFAPVAEAAGLVLLPLETDRRAETGASGEQVVAAHLQALGWRILAQRFRTQGGEVDLVAEEGGTLVFVEVKARRSRSHGQPAESVDARKRARIVLAAHAWMAEHRALDRPCRFDVAEVRFQPDGAAALNLLRGAFFAGE